LSIETHDKCTQYIIIYECLFLAISAGKKRYKTANLRKIRRHYQQDTLREQIIPDESNRFRYFYHIRRAHGDALSTVRIFFVLMNAKVFNRSWITYIESKCMSRLDGIALPLLVDD
jgi:arginine/lysine/ornithine decarboxylase